MIKLTDALEALHIVFDKPPSHEAGRFVECETPDGRSLNAGEWRERDDGLWELRIPASLFAALRQRDADAVPRDVAEGWKAKAENYQKERKELLADISDMITNHVDNWPSPKKLKTAIALIGKTLDAMVPRGRHIDSAIDLMGEALFNFSGRMKMAGVFTSGSELTDRNAASYERVVSAWQKLTDTIELSKLPTWDHYAEEHVTPDVGPGDLVEELLEPKVWRAQKLRGGSVNYNSDAPFRAAAAIQSLTARLEMVPGWSQHADGIACRDATIEGLDERVASLTAERDAALARVAELEAGLDQAAETLDQIIDDLGGGQCVCLAVKDEAIETLSATRALLEGPKP